MSDEMNPMRDDNQISKLQPFSGQQLDSREVHVIRFDLQSEASRLEECWEVLGKDERQRAERFHFKIHRDRFVVGRATLRTLLATYLNIGPALLKFEYESNGKPFIKDVSGLHFSLSHCDDLALLAITKLGAIGVDIERIRPVPDADLLVKRFFSPREARHFAQLPVEMRDSAFFNLWTRKEALLKATGEGIAEALNRVEVTFVPGERARLLDYPLAPRELNSARFEIYSVSAAAGCTAAVALAGDRPNLRIFEWRPHGPAEPILAPLSCLD